jgi:hypothetical protein
MVGPVTLSRYPDAGPATGAEPTEFFPACSSRTARAAYGCNIGAYFSGIASGSLHGWLWLPAAFAGSAIGTHLRPMFDLGVERTPRCCPPCTVKS